MKVNKNGVIALSSLFAAAGSGLAAAAGPDFSAVTSGVDWTTVVTGVMAVGALVAAVYVAIRGTKMLLGMIKA